MTFSSIDDLLDSAVETVSDALGDEIRVVRKFPSSIKPSPLDKITVSVSLKNFKSSGGEDGSDDIKYVCVMELGVFVPFSLDATEAYDVISSAVRSLSQSADFPVSETEIGELKPKRTTGSYEIYADVELIFSQGEGGGEIITESDIPIFVNSVFVGGAKSFAIQTETDTERISEYGENEYYALASGSVTDSIEITLGDNCYSGDLICLRGSDVELGFPDRQIILGGATAVKVKNETESSGERKCVVTLIGKSLTNSAAEPEI